MFRHFAAKSHAFCSWRGGGSAALLRVGLYAIPTPFEDLIPKNWDVLSIRKVMPRIR